MPVVPYYPGEEPDPEDAPDVDRIIDRILDRDDPVSVRS